MEADQSLRLDYEQTTQLLRTLTDIRFKLIAFVPTIAGTAVAFMGAGRSDAELVGYCQLVAAKIAKERKLEHGFRTVYNVGPDAGQTVFHLHLHLLGGRQMHWPPG